MISWFMGADALQGNGVTTKMLFLFKERKLIRPDDPMLRVRRSRILLFIALQLAGFGATFAIVQTIGMSSLENIFILNYD